MPIKKLLAKIDSKKNLTVTSFFCRWHSIFLSVFLSHFFYSEAFPQAIEEHSITYDQVDIFFENLSKKIEEHRQAIDSEEMRKDFYLYLDKTLVIADSFFNDLIQKSERPSSLLDRSRLQLLYGNFLMEQGEYTEAKGLNYLEESLSNNSISDETYNALAVYYGHRGPISKSLDFFEIAICINPDEAQYFINLATTVLLFREDSKIFYHLESDDAVLDKALSLYRKAIELLPHRFDIRENYAEAFYLYKPLRLNDLEKAWKSALDVAVTEEDREYCFSQLGRIMIQKKDWAQAQFWLDKMISGIFENLKIRLLKDLEKKKTQEGRDKENISPKSK